MASCGPKRWHLLCYDIRCDRRLQRVHRVVSGAALAVQRSVYLFYGSDVAFSRLVASVESRIAPEDDVRFYPIPHPRQIWSSRVVRLEGDAPQDDSMPLLLDDRGEDVLSGFRLRAGRFLSKVSSYVARG